MHLAGLTALADLHVGLHRHVHVGFHGIPAGDVHEQALHLLRCAHERLVVLLGTGIHVPLARRAERLQHRPVQLEVLQHVHADGDLRGNLDAGAAQFGVAHGGVHVAHLQKRAGNAHGEIQTRTLGDELVVHVAAVVAHETVGGRALIRRGADDADHGVDGEAHAVEVGHASLDLDLLRAVVGALEQRPAMVVSGDGALIGHLNVVDVHDKHVAHLGPFHVHRAGGRVGDVVGEVHVLHGDGLVG